MKIKEMTFFKEMKVGLPNFSNITVAHGMTLEVGDGEIIDKEKVWDEINQQLSIQRDNIEPAWVEVKEYKNFYKTVIKSKKGGEK